MRQPVGRKEFCKASLAAGSGLINEWSQRRTSWTRIRRDTLCWFACRSKPQSRHLPAPLSARHRPEPTVPPPRPARLACPESYRPSGARDGQNRRLSASRHELSCVNCALTITSCDAQGNLDMVPDMVKQFVVYFYRHIRQVSRLPTVPRRGPRYRRYLRTCLFDSSSRLSSSQ